jgi:hypothetical protein
VRSAYSIANLLAEWVVLPLLIAALLLGVAESLWTPWGLFRHYWVLMKLIITAVATIVLLLQMHPIGQLAGAAAELVQIDPGLQLRVLIHAAGGLLVLLAPVALSVYKPASSMRF